MGTVFGSTGIPRNFENFPRHFALYQWLLHAYLRVITLGGSTCHRLEDHSISLGDFILPRGRSLLKRVEVICVRLKHQENLIVTLVCFEDSGRSPHEKILHNFKAAWSISVRQIFFKIDFNMSTIK